ncbi:hypothetical protein CEXT_731371 [Caerostris extrusa]|uniref:Uncharacterized protein n=1 Tax=Caerostris extrusa TaxID=172846 RepID=A0AAV4PJA2_CAEEX|nr:hypothetical protein CEXT_731371 [Caerostris extrusa]
MRFLPCQSSLNHSSSEIHSYCRTCSPIYRNHTARQSMYQTHTHGIWGTENAHESVKLLLAEKKAKKNRDIFILSPCG